MKSRTIILPIALAVPAFMSTMPQSAPALASEPIVARHNPLIGELDAVVAGALDTSVLLAGHVAVVNDKSLPGMGASTTCKPKLNAKGASNASSTCQTKLKANALAPTAGRNPPPPPKKSNPATHKP